MLFKNVPDTIQNYLEDNSNLPAGNTLGVAIPANETELVRFVRQANREKNSLTISGGGTGTTGGRIPYGGYVLSTEKLNRIKRIEKDSVIVEPGVLYQDLDRELQKKGMLLPPNPTETTCFIGGNAATNASGSRSFKYGAIRQYVNRLRIVLGNGDILDLRRGEVKADNNGVFSLRLSSGCQIILQRPIYTTPDTKNTAGYYSAPAMDLLDLFIGSEGTLGIFTEIELQLLPSFKNLSAFFVFLPEEKSVFNLAAAITNLAPIGIEYFDSNSLQLLQPLYPQLPPGRFSGLYIEQDIPADEDKTLAGWLELFKRYKIPDKHIWYGQSKKDLQFYHDLRHALPEKINELVKKHRHIKLSSDIAVPAGKLLSMLDSYRRAFSEARIPCFIFGHIGENHLHTNLLPNTPEQVEEAKRIYLALMERAIQLGGTITAEHGVGKIKHEYLKLMYSEDGLREMARVKKVLDPNCLLNVDNIFPESYLL